MTTNRLFRKVVDYLPHRDLFESLKQFVKIDNNKTLRRSYSRDLNS